VRFVFRNFAFLGAESTAAAEAAECAEDQNKLWAYHDALYGAKVADEQGGGGEDDGFYNTAEFLKLAQQVGLNMSTFTTCVNTNQDAAIVAQDKTSAGTYGVNSTPSFFINGTAISGAQPYSVFQAFKDKIIVTVTKSWTEFTIGALLLISPWTLGFSDISLAKWCNVLFGLLLIMINAWIIFGDPAIPKKQTIISTSKKNKNLS
jgi:hypothetical protein